VISLPYSEPFSGVQELGLLLYQIKIVIKPYKTDEFVKSTRSFARKIRKEKGCLDCSVYRDSEKENTFSVIGKWRTRQAMEKHFKTQNFEVLIGAARVLGETFEINIAEVLETGCFELAKKQMASQDKVRGELP
jgi:quinol monooxygenase YgiN